MHSLVSTFPLRVHLPVGGPCLCVTSSFIKCFVCEALVGKPLGRFSPDYGKLFLLFAFCLQDASELRARRDEREKLWGTERRKASYLAYLYLQSNMKTHNQQGSYHGPTKSNLIDCKSGYSTAQPCTPVCTTLSLQLHHPEYSICPLFFS